MKCKRKRMLSGSANKALKIAWIIITDHLLHPLKELKWTRENDASKLSNFIQISSWMLKLGGNWQHCRIKWLCPCIIPSFAQACKCVQPDNKPQAQHWFGFKARERMVNSQFSQSSQSSLVWDHTNALALSRAGLVLWVAFPWTGASSGPLPLRAKNDDYLCSAHLGWGGRGGVGSCPLKCTSSAGWASLSASAVPPTHSFSVFPLLL